MARPRIVVADVLLFHAVCFYEDRPSLARTVARFIGEGLAANQAAVIVATASHGASIRDQLTADGAGSQRRIEQGELLVFDADEVLNRLMEGEGFNTVCDRHSHVVLPHTAL